MVTINYYRTLNIFLFRLSQRVYYYHKIHIIFRNIHHHYCIGEFHCHGSVLNYICNIMSLLFYYFLSNNLAIIITFEIHLYTQNFEDITNNNFQNFQKHLKGNRFPFRNSCIINIRNHFHM